MPALTAPGAFHLGRISSYAAAGAIAAASVDSLTLASTHVAALRPLWVLLHVFVFTWGAMLAVTGRQPLWAQRIGRSLESRLRPHAGGTWLGVLATAAGYAQGCVLPRSRTPDGRPKGCHSALASGCVDGGSPCRRSS